MKSAKALEPTLCWQLSTEIFQDKISYFEYLQKQRRLEFIQQLKFLKHWTPEKLQEFNLALGEIYLDTDKLLYNKGEVPQRFFIVKKGMLVLESIVELNESN